MTMEHPKLMVAFFCFLKDILLIFWEYLYLLDRCANFAPSVGLAFVTMLIPVAILVFHARDFEVLDKNVLLDYVVRARSLPVYLGLVLLAPSLWKFEKSN